MIRQDRRSTTLDYSSGTEGVEVFRLQRADVVDGVVVGLHRALSSWFGHHTRNPQIQLACPAPLGCVAFFPQCVIWQSVVSVQWPVAAGAHLPS